MPNLQAQQRGRRCASPRSMQDHLSPKKTATACSWRKPAFSELQPDLAQLGLVGRAERLAQLVGGRRDLRLERSCRRAACASTRPCAPRSGFSSRRSRSSAPPLRRSANDPRTAHDPSVIARKTAARDQMSSDSVMARHTLIATILLDHPGPEQLQHRGDRSAS